MKIWSSFVDFILGRKKASAPSKPSISTPPIVPKKITQTKEEALRSVLNRAEKEGFDPWIVYVQAYHESGGFKKVIGNFNYWGIKRPPSWTGKVHKLWTREYIKKPIDLRVYGNEYQIEKEDDKGIWIKLPQPFIDFNSAEEAIDFWIGLIKRIGVYKASWQRRHDYRKFFKFLKAWATDPDYSKKVIALYKSLKTKGKLA